ncbi:MAG: hypothetical protein RR350_04940, partial [Oscillibacter sp.]
QVPDSPQHTPPMVEQSIPRKVCVFGLFKYFSLQNGDAAKRCDSPDIYRVSAEQEKNQSFLCFSASQ